jgi:Hint module
MSSKLAPIVAFLIAVVVACAESINSGSLLAAMRVFNPNTASGVTFYKAANIPAPTCPTYKLVHEEILESNAVKSSYLAPHTKIVHDGVRCGTLGNGQEYMWLIPSLLLMDERSATAAGVLDAFKLMKSNARASSAFSSLVNVDPIFVGVELHADRVCGGKIAYPKGSIFFFIQAEGKHLDLGSLAWINNNENAMLGYQPPRAEGENSMLCVYKNSVVPGPTATPLPSPAAITSPAASSSPNAFAAIAGQGPSGREINSTGSPSPSASPSPNSADSDTIGTTPSPVTSTASSPPSVLSQTNTPKEASCFPASATVEIDNGDIVRMDSVRIGDRVRVGANKFSDVFMFTHKDTSSVHQFTRITLSSGESVSATSGHYMFANNGLKTAGSVVVGDVMTLANGAEETVIRISTETSLGLFNPQTLDGNLVVDGVLSSTYTQAVDANFAHAILSPLRFLYRLGALPAWGLFDSSSYRLARMAPQGAATM